MLPESIPNIFKLLKLFATLPMTSCSCKHSASDLWRLDTYLWSTQSEERLTSLAIIQKLAIIHSNYSMPVDIVKVTKLFMAKHPRRLKLPSLIYTKQLNYLHTCHITKYLLNFWFYHKTMHVLWPWHWVIINRYALFGIFQILKYMKVANHCKRFTINVYIP